MFIMKTTATLLAVLSTAASVSAHGILTSFTAGGQTYKVNRNNNKSPIWSVSSQDPNYGASNAAITCGPQSRPGTSVANVNPGDVMSFDWKGASGGNWPHNTGPLITYMANCGDKSCNDIGNPASLKWFKIDQQGADSKGVWAQAALMQGQPSRATIPQGLAPGNYMVRHEIIALHLANQFRMAEFYPGCVAVRVGGNAKGVPQGNLATFPGTYSDNDAGIKVDNKLYSRPREYSFPGPAVATFANGPAAPAPAPSSSPAPVPAPPATSAPASTSAASVPPAPAPSAPVPPKSNTGSGTTPKPSTGSKTCTKKNKNKKRAATPADTIAANEEVIVKPVAVKPRSHSRVMRRLAGKAGSMH